MTTDRSLPVAWVRRRELSDELTLLHERAESARQVARDVRDESREIVARCEEGRISRQNRRAT